MADFRSFVDFFLTFGSCIAKPSTLVRLSLLKLYFLGGKTQLVSVLSSILMLIVLIWLAPLFEPVPKSVLACIIIVALKNLFFQFRNLKDLWKISKFDFVSNRAFCLNSSKCIF